MDIGQNIKLLRKKNKLTQKDLAELLNVSSVTIQNYENNRRTPHLEMMKKISIALNVPVNTLLSVGETAKAYFSDQVQVDKSAFLDEASQKKIAFTLGNSFKSFLQNIDSSYTDMNPYILADIAQSREFNEFLEYLYFKYTKENIEGDINGNKEK